MSVCPGKLDVLWRRIHLQSAISKGSKIGDKTGYFYPGREVTVAQQICTNRNKSLFSLGVPRLRLLLLAILRIKQEGRQHTI